MRNQIEITVLDGKYDFDLPIYCQATKTISVYEMFECGRCAVHFLTKPEVCPECNETQFHHLAVDGEGFVVGWVNDDGEVSLEDSWYVEEYDYEDEYDDWEYLDSIDIEEEVE
jgi:hypothetical protein